MKEFDVHGYIKLPYAFYAIEAESPEEARTIAQSWLDDMTATITTGIRVDEYTADDKEFIIGDTIDTIELK